MKKITAFFMALLPFFVMVLLFVTGIIVKKVDPTIHATKVEITESSANIKKEKDDVNPEYQLVSNVLPKIANQEVYWRSSDPEIASVEKSTGKVTAKNFGDTYVYAQSVDNPSLEASCKIHVWDDKIHKINVDNEDIISYIGITNKQQIQVSTVPTDATDTNLIYEVEGTAEQKAKLDITPTGLILPKDVTDSNGVKIKISNPEKTISKEVTVRIGKGVSQVGLNNPSEETITSKTYNFWNDLIITPEDKTNLKPEDFIFTSDDETAATIDEKGVATFKAPSKDANAATYPSATFRAVYKRDNTISTTKKITCTCDNFKEVYFSTEDKHVSFDGTAKTIDDLKVYTYPQTDNFNDVTLTTSNSDVVSISKDALTGLPTFTANKCGYAMLSATVSTGDKDFPTKTDVCNVSIEPSSTDVLLDQKTVNLSTDDGYYYALRNNLKLDKKYCGQQTITWSSSDETIATVDNKNEILHFIKPGSVTIKGQTDWLGLDSFEFDVVRSDLAASSYELSDTATEVTLKAGQLVKFTSTKNWQPSFTESEKQNFDYTEDAQGVVVSFIPKCGMDLPALKLVSGQEERSIRLIVTEKPVELHSDIQPFVTIDNTDYYPYNFETNANVTVIPSTATMEDGQRYSDLIKYEYSCDSKTAKVEGNEITFTSYGMVLVTVKCGDFDPYQYVIKSTYGEIGRFGIVDEDGNDIQSYQQLTINDETNLYTKNSYTSKYKDDIKIESLNKLCDVKYEGTGGALIGGQTTFTITPKKDASNNTVYGNDVIRIYTNTYSFYLSVIISPKIQSVNLYHNGSLLDSTNTLTYTKNLTLYADVSPISTKDQKFSAKFNGGDEITPTKGVIDLSTQTNWVEDGENTLNFFRDGETEAFASYKINHKSETPKFKLFAEDKTTAYEKDLVLSSKSTSKIAYVMPEPYGLVDDSFYNDFNLELASKTTEIVKIEQGILCLSNFPMQAGNDRYTNTLKITHGTQEAISYNVSREMVSKVVLPNHDNNDESDLKGLQKTHVYGDRSFYTSAEGLVNYYKLPIDLYDYKGNLIKDKQTEDPSEVDLKALAYTELVPSIDSTRASIKYHAKDANNSTGFVEVVFAKSTLYTLKEIYDDAFVDGQKNVTIGFSTASKESSAQYSFVPVDGVNVYCQEGLKYVSNNLDTAPAVLQINFGLVGVEKDNVPLTDTSISNIGTVYGNGYTINFNEYFKAQKSMGAKVFNVAFGNIINATIQGAEINELSYDFNYAVVEGSWSPIPDFGNVFEYSTIRSFANGANMNPGTSCPDRHIKKCLFYNNLLSCIFAEMDGNNKTYVEDCIFFDSGSYPLMWGQGAKIYFKGFIDVYNFHNKDMLQNLFGMDFSFLWPTLEKVAKANNMVQIGADGRGYINSFGCVYLAHAYFWDQNKGEYVQGTRGLPGAGEYLDKYIDLELKVLSINAQLWGTHDPAHQSGAPSYYDEYDSQGVQRLDFLANQIKKLMRQIV